ncbi:MAG: hypothetical protein HY075_05305 [Deltaproteobacteria bacterium]|nr:hypothetical protein [Deltaproteobacteria bacterium]
MVRKTITLILLLSTTCQAAGLPGTGALYLRWEGSKSAVCQKLIELFLAELRSLAGDRPIRLEAAPTPPRVPAADPAPQGEGAQRTLTIACPANANPVSTVLASEGDETVTLHYLAKANGFDAADWLPFQQKFLRPRAEPVAVALAPVAREPDPIAPPVSAIETSATEPGDKPFFKRWWFWALVGSAAAGGAYAFSRAASRDSGSINVEIR